MKLSGRPSAAASADQRADLHLGERGRDVVERLGAQPSGDLVEQRVSYPARNMRTTTVSPDVFRSG